MISAVNQIQQGTELVNQKQLELTEHLSGKSVEKEINQLKAERDKYNIDSDEWKVANEAIKTTEKTAEAIKDASNYVTFNRNADGTVTADYKQDEIEKARASGELTSEKFNEIQQWVEEATTISGEIQEAIATNVSNITELYTALGDLRQQYADSAKELREAYGAQQQKVIDNLKSV